MSYDTTTISAIMEKANSNVICLPSIQRQFVWGASQIEMLFDSIYQGYPIGTFLIWNVKKEDVNAYKFYYLLRDYHEKDKTFNEAAPSPQLAKELEAALDGQQRMTALFIALQGSYSTKKPGGHINNPAAYIKRHLYFNLLGFKTGIAENEIEGLNLFKMLSDKELAKENEKNSPHSFWVIAKDFIDNSIWGDLDDKVEEEDQILMDYLNRINSICINELIKKNDKDFRLLLKHILKFKKRLHEDKIISYYSINSKTKLDEVAEIFIRINSGGTKLSKSDLLFSTVISNWEAGRDKIHQLIKDVKLLGYDIDTDFLMRTCLYLTESEILFKVENFKQDVVDKIINQFEKENDEVDIRKAVLAAFNFLKDDLGIAEKTLKSKNVLIPLIYHIYKGGDIESDESIKEIQKYIYISLLKKVFGSHGDTLLGKLRNGVVKNPKENFNFKNLVNAITEKDKRKAYDITLEDIEDFLKIEKGDEGWLVLSLIYPPLKHEMTSYDQDHLHPRSKFKKKAFENNDFELADTLKDTIPNLGFLTPRDNRKEKIAKTLANYIKEAIPSDMQTEYKIFNKIDLGISLELKDFMNFYNTRKSMMKAILCEKLEVDITILPDAVEETDE
jgi:uncharacterized protein with ParB-like and HNH nuclease domain